MHRPGLWLAVCISTSIACSGGDGASEDTPASSSATSTPPGPTESSATEPDPGDTTASPTTGPGPGESSDDSAGPTTDPSTPGTDTTDVSDPTSGTNDPSDTTDTTDATDTTDTGVEPSALPPVDGEFDYQLGGAYPPPDGVVIVSRDRTAAPEPGLYNVCYVNGFQAQPDAADWWLSEHPDLILRDDGGDPVIDVDWDEMLLDTSTPEKRAMLAEIVGEWISGCAADGFDAIEIDNLDSYSRSTGLLTQDHNVETMALFSAAAHASGLAIAQKNSTELLDRRAEMGTDFAVSEECSTYDECGDYVDAYGDAVLMIEYIEADFQKGCGDWPGHSIVLRDLDLVGPQDGDYVFDAC